MNYAARRQSAQPAKHWAGVSFGAPPLLASPILAPWLLYSLYLLWRRPERREKQVRRVGYVLAAFAASSMLWVIQQFARGAYAERVIRAVKSYGAEHGQYPETLEQVGFATCCQGTATRQWEIAYVRASGEKGIPQFSIAGRCLFR